MKLNATFLKNINTIVDCNIDIAIQYNCFSNNKAIFNSKSAKKGTILQNIMKNTSQL